jgi:hypothetical protein
MRVFVKYFSIIFVCIALCASGAAAQVRVVAQVDTSRDIYVGENFAYNIIIDGENTPGQVDLSPLAKYNPQGAGNRDISQSSISIINGKTTQNVIKRYVMSYSLSVNAPGRLSLPPVTVTLDGKTYRTNPVEINVITPGTTDQLDLETTLSEQQCYVGQPVVMTVKFYICADIGDFGFNIPAFNGDNFYIEEPDISNAQTREYNLGNGITVRVSQTRTVHNGKDSILLSFSKVLIPKQSGEIDIPPASVSADVAVGTVRSRDRMFDDSFFNGFFGAQKQYKRFMVSSQPLKLAVQPLPEENKPAGFYGLVGRYTISASAAPTKVNVGDPITLNISISGGRYLKPVQWPELEQIPELVANFRIPSQKSSPTIQNDAKIFTQTIRANNDRVTEIPSIPLAYFDPEKGQYSIARSEPIKLEVSPSKVLTNADMEGSELAPVSKEVEAIRKGLSANYEGQDALENQDFSPAVAFVQPGYLVIWASPLVLVILSVVAKFSMHKTPEKIAQKRRRGAAGKAIGQLRKIASSAGQQHDNLASIMKQYIGERFDKTAGALTSNDCFEIVADATKDTQSAGRFREIVADCEAARYTSAENSLGQAQIEEVVGLIRTIEKKSVK